MKAQSVILSSLFALGGTLLSGSSLATEADLNISDKSVNAQLTWVSGTRDSEFGAGYVYRKGGVHILDLNGHARGQTAIGNYPTTVAVGAQFNSFDEDVIDGAALGLGGSVHIKIPEVPGLGVKLGGWFAPSITSFGDSEQFYRTQAKVTYRIIPNADVYIGYRSIRSELENDRDVTLDENVHLGFMILF